MRVHNGTSFNGTDWEQNINFTDILSLFMQREDGLTDASVEEVAAVCDVMAAYSSVCSQRSVKLNLPSVCSE